MTDSQRPLRDDIQRLGSILGDVIRHHAGSTVFTCIESVRAATKAARGPDPESLDGVQADLRALGPVDARAVTRGFALFLTLANVAEQHHRLRRRRDYEREGRAPQPGSLEDCFARLLDAGHAPQQILAALRTQRVELVLTAHPTEITRSTTVHKLNHVATLLRENDRGDLTVHEREEVERGLRAAITALWLTDEIRRDAPTPLDEVRAGLFWFEQTIWDAAADFGRRLDRACRSHLGEELGNLEYPLRFGSWMGGDRDGNPNVTAAITRRAVCLARAFACTLYRREIGELAEELSLGTASESLRRAAPDTREPYRTVLNGLREGLGQSRRHWLRGYHHPEGLVEGTAPVDLEALRETLELVQSSLREVGANALADGRVRDLLRRSSLFGLVLARLDLRQDSSVHTAIADALTAGRWATLSEDERLALLEEWRSGAAPSLKKLLEKLEDGEARETIQLMLSLDEIGADALGSYVISMARYASDVLLVEALQTMAGVHEPCRVVPLFETVEDLQTAPQTLDALFRARARALGEEAPAQQQIMIGYSDSAKTAGRLASAWALFEAQEQMTEVAARHGVTLQFFHGRGGTVGRGGGPTSLAIQSQPPETVRGALRVTEQGEMIQAKFGLPGIAVRTLEVYTTSVLETTLARPLRIDPKWRTAMAEMSRASLDAYRECVQETPDFVEYFRQCTPEVELAHLRIGSRPQRRSGKASGIHSLRAIPWVFAWMQTRWLLPAWLGVDAGLATIDPALCREMTERWPFFRSLLDLEEMVLAKAEPRIAERYEKALVDPDLHAVGDDLRARFVRTRTAILAATGQDRLLGSRPVLARSIDVRNPYVDPINLMQIEALRHFRENENDHEALDLLLRTMNGVAAGMRNTG